MEILEALSSVTKSPEEASAFKDLSDTEKLDAYLSFIKRAKNNSIGRRVKQADILDNLKIERIPKLTSADIERLNRYKVALQYLCDG